MYPGFTCRAPSIVFSSTGQITPKMIAATSIGVPILNTKRKTGTSIGGRDRPAEVHQRLGELGQHRQPADRDAERDAAMLAAAQPPSMRPRLGSRFPVASEVSHR